MTKTYCALPFRESMLLPGDVLLLCCRHPTNVVIDKSFDESYRNGKIQEIREMMLKGETIPGCEQCYREEEQGIESMRQESIRKYGMVDDIEIQALHIQFDNLCNLKCRMCTSVSSHLLYESEIELYGSSINWEKYSTTDRYKEIDISDLNEVRLHGGEPFLSRRVEDFFQMLEEKKQIEKISVITPTNGTIKPSNKLLKTLLKTKSLSIWISIDAYGKLNDYFRSNSEFNTIIENLDYLYSLIDLRYDKNTTIGVNTTVNVYNVNKLKELDSFLESRYPKLKFQKSILHNPDHLRISCLPIEYKHKIQHTLNEYPDILKILNIKDDDYFDEFVFYHNQLDKSRQESLENLNLDLSEYIRTHKPKKQITTEDIIKFVRFVDPTEIKK